MLLLTYLLNLWFTLCFSLLCVCS